jgi:hypothetical protein
LRKTVLAIALLVLISAPSYAQYNIHLKNGSVIRGVGHYDEVDGEIRFLYLGGTVGIQRENVLKIEEARTGDVVIAPEPGTSAVPERSKPVVPSYQMEPMDTGPDTGPVKERLAEVNRRLSDIDARLAEYDKVREEYDRVRLRIEVLFQKGIAEAKKKGEDPAKWFTFLPAQEREWAQLNTLKKNKMKKEVEEIERLNAPLIAEKERLLQEKGDLEQRLRDMESPY